MKANDPVYRIVAKSHYENTNTYNREAQKPPDYVWVNIFLHENFRDDYPYVEEHSEHFYWNRTKLKSWPFLLP